LLGEGSVSNLTAMKSFKHCSALAFAVAALAVAIPSLSHARPNPGGVGGPASGAGVRPGLGYGAPGAGMDRR